MGFEINEKQLRIRYIRVVEKFLTRTISLLKLENFDKELFLKRTLKNYEDMRKSQLDSKAIEQAVKLREEELQAQFEKEKKILVAEKEKEQIAKQQLLSRVMDLESSQMEMSHNVRGPVGERKRAPSRCHDFMCQCKIDFLTF